VVAEEPVHNFSAKYSDIDINGHVNSVRYIEHILDLLPLEKHREERLKRFEIAYITESYFGDQLDIYMDEDKNENVYMVEVRKHFSGEVVCRAKMEWKVEN
jgi:acyl-ACP thioesterase